MKIPSSVSIKQTLAKLPEKIKIPRYIEEKKFYPSTEGRLNIGDGIIEGGITEHLAVYYDAVAKNIKSTEGAHISGFAKLIGGEQNYLIVIDNATAADTKVNTAVLYGRAKISNSEGVFFEANDLATLKNIKAEKIVMNGFFTKLKGKNNKCQELEAPLIWRILNLDFRKQIL